MSDLHSLIRRSIIDRGLTSPAARREIYEQARTAVIRELWSYDPPLAEDEIDARIGQFDLAVGELEDDLAEVFTEPAEPPRAAPRSPPAKRMPTVFEGYDDEADYVPAYIAAPPPSSRERPASAGASASRAIVRKRGGEVLDPLELRSAAIEEALRSGDAGLDREDDRTGEPSEAEAIGFDESDPSLDPDEGDSPAHWSWERDHPGARDDRAEDDGDDAGDPEQAQFRTGENQEDDPEPARRQRWTALLGNLDERTRIRILIGAIASLAVVLVLLAGFMLSSLFSSSGGSPQTAAPDLVPETGTRGPAAPAIPAAAPTDSVQTFAVFDGSDPTIFDSGPGNPVRFDKSGGFARITSSTSDPGVRVVVGPGLATRLAGRSVRVTLIARSAGENGASGLRFAYENGLAISPWQTANLGNDFQTYNLVWRVPAMRADPGADQLLIEPGIPGDGTAADIQSIKIDLLTE
jgi:hypothetical protein